MHDSDIVNDVIDNAGRVLVQVALRFFIFETFIGDGDVSALDDAYVFATVPDGNQFIVVNDMGREWNIDCSILDTVKYLAP